MKNNNVMKIFAIVSFSLFFFCYLLCIKTVKVTMCFVCLSFAPTDLQVVAIQPGYTIPVK